MCLDCGCNKPDERHGNKSHLIMQDLVDAAKANEKPVPKIFENIENTTKQVIEGKLKSSAWKP